VTFCRDFWVNAPDQVLLMDGTIPPPEYKNNMLIPTEHLRSMLRSNRGQGSAIGLQYGNDTISLPSIDIAKAQLTEFVRKLQTLFPGESFHSAVMAILSPAIVAVSRHRLGGRGTYATVVHGPPASGKTTALRLLLNIMARPDCCLSGASTAAHMLERGGTMCHNIYAIDDQLISNNQLMDFLHKAFDQSSSNTIAHGECYVYSVLVFTSNHASLGITRDSTLQRLLNVELITNPPISTEDRAEMLQFSENKAGGKSCLPAILNIANDAASGLTVSNTPIQLIVCVTESME
jgi:hypothetical protein